MDCELAIKAEREMLQRIVALYLKLACLCDRACARSWPIRWLLLWALRSAEACALQRIAEAEPRLYPSLAQSRLDTLSEVRRLARCFRAAARSTKKLLRTMVRCQCPRSADSATGHVAQLDRDSVVDRVFSAVKSLFVGGAWRFAERLDSS